MTLFWLLNDFPLSENRTMALQPNRRVLMPVEGIQELLDHKERVQEEALGKVPDGLAQSTVLSVMRLARSEAPGQVLSARVRELVRQTLHAAARQHWKPDTALILRKRLGAGHGPSQ